MDIDDVGWEPLNGEQQDTVRDVTLEVNNLVDIKLKEVDDNGDIRFNIIDMNRLVDGSDDVAGFSFYPAENPDYGGDVLIFKF